MVDGWTNIVQPKRANENTHSLSAWNAHIILVGVFQQVQLSIHGVVEGLEIILLQVKFLSNE